MTYILGISGLYHDSAAALIKDGKIISAAQEERFTRKKHDNSFPVNAINFCLSYAKITPSQLDAVSFYEKPLLKLDRLFEMYCRFVPKGFLSFFNAFPGLMKEKLRITKKIDRVLEADFTGPIYFPTHHQSHAASAFFSSPFESSAILTIDAVGEWETTTWGTGSGNKITMNKSIRFPHSLGLLYSAFTTYIGFRANSGEYKLMGLAPYGKPIYYQQILDHLIDVKPDGSFVMNQSYFCYYTGLRMTSRKFHKLFGGPPKKPDSNMTQREMDLAASIQKVLEHVVLKICATIKKETGEKNLCLAGGVALNCVANTKILESKLFDHIWIQPAAGDAGGALGSALFAYHQILGNSRKAPTSPDLMQGMYLGPQYSNDEVKKMLEKERASFTYFESKSDLHKEIAKNLSNGMVIGYFSGRMEYGPRALGSRSILGDPRDRDMQKQMNLKIKY